MNFLGCIQNGSCVVEEHYWGSASHYLKCQIQNTVRRQRSENLQQGRWANTKNSLTLSFLIGQIFLQKLQLFWILSLLHWLNEIILFYLIVICQTQGHLPTPTPQTHSFGDKKKLNRFIVVAVCLSHVGSYSMSIMRTILPRIVIAFECLVLQIIIADCLLHKSF